MAVEATASYEWFVALIEPLAQKVVLANPKKLRVIAESTKKTDKLDAQVLAEFLARDMIPQAYRPTPRQREHRILVRHRQYLKQGVTAIKNKIRRILGDYNADRKDLFTAEGWPKALTGVKLSDSDQFVLDQLHADWKFLEGQIDELTKRLKEFAKKAPAREAKARAKLATIKGVGAVTIEVVISELGDVSRFKSSKAVTAYAGLAPRVRQERRQGEGPGDHQGGLAAVAVGVGGGVVAGDPPERGVGTDLSRDQEASGRQEGDRGGGASAAVRDVRDAPRRQELRPVESGRGAARPEAEGGGVNHGEARRQTNLEVNESSMI